MGFIATRRSVSDAGFHDRKCGHEECCFTLLAVRILAREGVEGAGSIFQIIVMVESSSFQVSNVVLEVGVRCGWAKSLFNFLPCCLLIIERARGEIRLHVCAR